MLPANASNPRTEDPVLVVDEYRDYLASRGHGSSPAFAAARTFMARWPAPEDWLNEPLQTRWETKHHTTPFVLFLMLTGRIHGDYGYLLETKLTNILSACAGQSLEAELLFFLSQARTLGFSDRVSRAMTTGIVAWILLHRGGPLSAVGAGDLEEVEAACRAREQRSGLSAHPYRVLPPMFAGCFSMPSSWPNQHRNQILVVTSPNEWKRFTGHWAGPWCGI